MADEPEGQATYTQANTPEPPPDDPEITPDLDPFLTEDERRQAADMDNAADRMQIKKRAKRRQLDIEERRMVVKTLLQHPAGQKFLAWLVCDVAGVYAAAMDATLNTNFHFHREGQRACGLILQAECLATARVAYMEAIGNHLTQGNRK